MAFDGSIKFDTALDESGLEKGLSGLCGSAAKAGAAVAAAAGAGIGAAVKIGMDFESAMSQVAATMGITTEEIANGSKAYEILREAAVEAGEKTKFSAQEAAQALNYLALAGYDAEKAAEVLPSVLNLAAAGGLDLAYASDLATDAMAALGIEATSANLVHFGDELAKTAQKSNTSVGQLGEAILVCAGTAKNAGQSLETINTALGVMANRGIKGSEGGTHLRNVLLSLTAPTDKAAKKLNALGVSVADGEGNIRALDDILKDLNKSLSGMSEKDKINAISEIFNKTDISAVNALLSGSAEEWDNLKTHISNADGAMQNMADTMNDNLKGRMDELSSVSESLGIAIYDKIETPLKHAVESGIESIGDLVSSINSGELSGALDNVGTLVGTLAQNLSGVLTVAVTGIINVLAFLGEHIDAVAEALTVLVTAFAAVSAANTVITVIKGIGAALAVLATTGGMISAVVAALAAMVATIVVLKKEMDSRDPMKQAAKSAKEAQKATEENLKSLKEAKKAYADSSAEQLRGISVLKNYADELRDITDENGRVKSGMEERASYLISALNEAFGTEMSLQDGVIQKYDEVIAKIDEVITKKKIESLINSQEGSYNESLNAVDEATQKVVSSKQQLERANKTLQAAEAEYNRILQEGVSAYGSSVDASKAWLNDKNQAAEALQNAKERVNSLSQAYEQNKASAQIHYDTISAYNDLLEANASGDYAAMQAAMLNYRTVQNQATQEAIANGQSEVNALKSQLASQASAMGLAIEQEKNFGKNTGEVTKQMQSDMQGTVKALLEEGASLQEALSVLGGTGAELISMVDGQFDTASQAFIQTLAEMTNKAPEEIASMIQQSQQVAEKLPESMSVHFEAASPILSSKAAEMGKATGEGISQGIQEGSQNVSEATTTTINTAITSGTEAASGATEVGSQMAAGIAQGITANSGQIKAAATQAVNSAVAAAKAAADIHSPSRVMRDEVGAMLVEGIKVGITSRIDEVPEAFEKMVEDIKLQLDIGAITEKEYYKKLEQYRDEYLAKGSDEWWEYTKQILKYETELEEKQRDMEFKRLERLKELRIVSESEYYTALAALRDKYFQKGTDEWQEYTDNISQYYADTLYDKINQMYNTLQSKQQEIAGAMGSVSATRKSSYMWDGIEYSATRLRDEDNLKERIKDIEAFEVSILELQRILREDYGLSDIPEILSSEILSAWQNDNDDAIKLVNSIIKKSAGGGLNTWLDYYSQLSSKPDEIAKKLTKNESEAFEDIVQNAETAINELGENFLIEVAKDFGGLPKMLKDAGFESGKSFAEQFKAQVAESMKDIQSIVATAMSSIIPVTSSVGGNYQYNTYNLTASSSTVTEQLKETARAAEVERLRGGYN